MGTWLPQNHLKNTVVPLQISHPTALCSHGWGYLPGGIFPVEWNTLRMEDWNEAKAFSISDFAHFFFCNNTKGRKRIRKWVRGRWKERWSIKQSYFFTLWIYSPDRHLFSKLLIFYIQILWLSVLGPRFVWTDYPLIFTMKLNYPFYVFRYFQLFPELFLETESSWWVSQ